MREITVRSDGGDMLKITLFGRSYPDAVDSDDGNWLQTAIKVVAGGFRGSVACCFRAEELAEFHGQLARLQESLNGTAVFESMEGQLSVSVTGDGRGHMHLKCTIRDQPGIGNTLHCVLDTDQTFVRATLAELAAAVEAFPAIAEP
jgi:hypothetical protein